MHGHMPRALCRSATPRVLSSPGHEACKPARESRVYSEPPETTKRAHSAVSRNVRLGVLVHSLSLIHI
eukprot:8447613-Alexandrium_andersonii.AAC.1